MRPWPARPRPLPAWRALAPGTARRHPARSHDRARGCARGARRPRGAQRGQADRRGARRDRRCAIATFRYFSAAPERLLGDTIPVDGGIAMTFREPIGVVGLITPWNFPLAIASWKLAPALAAGNTVVLKPAELTPLTAVRFAEIAARGRRSGGRRERRRRPGADLRAAARRAPRRRQDRLHRLDRGRRVDRRRRSRHDQARHARAGRQVGEHRLRRRRRRGRGGRRARSDVRQRRAGLLRTLAHARRGERRRPVPRGARAGGHRESASATRSTRRPRWARSSPPASARAWPASSPTARPSPSGASAPDGPGYWFAPTSCTRSTASDRAATEEIFGPVACVIPFRGEAEAIRLANDTIYGLSGSVWTRDGAKALRVARALEAGNLSINSNSSVRVTTPFGGFKQSGYGRELGPHATDAYTEVKTVYYRTQED